MNGRNRLYDTDILIDFLRGETKAKELIFKEKEYSRQCISVITVAELHTGIRNEIEEATINYLIGYFEVLEINEEVSKLGGKYRRLYYKSHNLVLPDALIAATAEYFALDLNTLNTKHYPMIKNLKAAYRKA